MNWNQRSTKLLEDYRNEFGIEIGMTKGKALERFREWKDLRRTCARCESEQYRAYCPLHLICEEAEKEEESGRQIDIGSGASENLGLEEAGLSRNEEYPGFGLCESV